MQLLTLDFDLEMMNWGLPIINKNEITFLRGDNGMQIIACKY